MLKIFAIIIMTIDHIGHHLGFIMPEWLYLLTRFVGRIAFPIFAWQLALGYRRTSNICLYGLRLLIFAFVSDFAIRLAGRGFENDHDPNILFTLALGIVFITAWEMMAHSRRDRLVRMELIRETPGQAPPWQFRFNTGFSLNPSVGFIVGLIFFVFAAWASLYFKTDYNVYGLMTILLFHLTLNHREEERPLFALAAQSTLNIVVICGSVFLLSSSVFYKYYSFLYEYFSWNPIQAFSIMAIPFIFKLPSRSKKPGLLAKYFFYFYYPIHLVIIILIAKYIWAHS